SFGATHLGTMMYLSRAAPEASRAAAQGDVATANTVAMAAASALAGLLYGMSGSLAYLAMAALAAAGVMCAMLAPPSRCDKWALTHSLPPPPHNGIRRTRRSQPFSAAPPSPTSDQSPAAFPGRSFFWSRRKGGASCCDWKAPQVHCAIRI